MDLEGLDTACKLVILANHLGLKAELGDVKIKGIEELNVTDILEAKQRGKAIRLIGVLSENLKVSPEEIPIGNVLHVERNLNAISIKTNLGTRTLIGVGAGGRQTASSALRDLLFIIQHRSRKKVITAQVAAK
jgi:homoserine dehydrogenase